MHQFNVEMKGIEVDVVIFFCQVEFKKKIVYFFI